MQNITSNVIKFVVKSIKKGINLFFLNQSVKLCMSAIHSIRLGQRKSISCKALEELCNIVLMILHPASNETHVDEARTLERCYSHQRR